MKCDGQGCNHPAEWIYPEGEATWFGCDIHRNLVDKAALLEGVPVGLGTDEHDPNHWVPIHNPTTHINL